MVPLLTTSPNLSWPLAALTTGSYRWPIVACSFLQLCHRIWHFRQGLYCSDGRGDGRAAITQNAGVTKKAAKWKTESMRLGTTLRALEPEGFQLIMVNNG